jgi:hypothetical protein
MPPWLPRPASWASSVALFAFARGVSIAMALLVPLLFALMRVSPRLAWLGIFGVWLAPIGLAALAHRATSRLLDLVDMSRDDRPAETTVTSLRAGLFAWLSILFVTTATALAMLVIDPPPVEPDAMLGIFMSAMGGGAGLVGTAIWILITAYVYELDRRAAGA